jgi:hypothetical protein
VKVVAILISTAGELEVAVFGTAVLSASNLQCFAHYDFKRWVRPLYKFVYTVSKLKISSCNTLYVSICVLEHLQAESYTCHLLLRCLTQRAIRNLGDWDGKGQYGLD